MKKTAVFSFLIFSILGTGVFALNFVKSVSTQSDRILSKAQHAFEKGRYTEAMSICEEARIARKNEINWQCSVINNVLGTAVGHYIPDLMPILKTREEYDAIEIINSQLEKHGADFFDNSLPKLYEYLQSLKNYPESDFLLAKIYRLEGEYDLSKNYLMRALTHSNILDVPAQKYDILYEMADLAKVQGEEKNYEESLLLIVADDGLYKNKTMKNALYKSVALNRKGVDLAEYFLQFFRFNAINSMRAYFELAELYEKRNEKKESFAMTAFGVIVGFTHTVEILDDRLGSIAFDEDSRRAIEFFFLECGRNEDIMEWTKESGLWRGFFNMAMRAKKNGWDDFGNTFLKKLENYCPDEYWKKVAAEVNKTFSVTTVQQKSEALDSNQ